MDRRALVQRLRSLDLRPVKALGQHFLLDPAAIEAAVNAAELRRTDHVVEIGPGPGVLTQALVQAVDQVTAIELDRNMVQLLEPLRLSHPGLDILEQNALAADPRTLARDRPYKIVANLPYYIASAVIRQFLETDFPPTLMVIMVQKEVAVRICAEPGDMSVLSVSVRAFAEPDIVRVVPSTAFYPPPKVDSALLRLRILPAPVVVPARQRRFFRLVRAGFQDRRKQIHNALARNLGSNQRVVDAILREADIDASRRAETLSMGEWLALLDALERHEVS